MRVCVEFLSLKWIKNMSQNGCLKYLFHHSELGNMWFSFRKCLPLQSDLTDGI